MSKKVCVIVGFGQGVGLGVAKAFAGAGYSLALLARNIAKVQPLVNSLTNEHGVDIELINTDAANETSLRDALALAHAEVGPADVLIYNVVAPTFVLPSALSADQLVSDFRANVVGALVATQAVLPAMRERGSGTILFTGGGWAHYPSAQASAISIGKAGLRSLAFTLNEELAGSGIRAGMLSIMGAVAPGTPFDPEVIGDAFLVRVQEPGPTFAPEVLFHGRQP